MQVCLVSVSAHGISIYYIVPTPYPHRTLAWHRDTLLSIIGPWLLHQPWPTQGQHTFIKTQTYVCFRYYSKRYLEKILLSFFHTFAQFANVCCSNFTKYQAKVDHLQSQARRTAARENGFYSFAPSLTQHEEFYNNQRSSNNWRPLYSELMNPLFNLRSPMEISFSMSVVIHAGVSILWLISS